MSAFAAALGTLFTDPNLSVAASYAPLSGETISLSIVWDRTDRDQINDPFGKTGMVLPSYLAHVRVADLAQPREDDQLIVDSVTFRVRSFELVEDKTVWQLNLDKEG